MERRVRLPTAERKRQIAQAALRIISTEGVRRLTAVALANEVGIADGTIFRHFKNKEAIVDAAIDLFVETLEATYPPEGGEPLERLGKFLVQRLTLVRRQPELLRLAFNDRLAEAAGAEGAARVERHVARSIAFVHDCLDGARARGEVTRDTPITILIWTVIGVVRGASMTATHRIDGERLSRAPARAIWEALEQFLRSTAPQRSDPK